MLLLWQPILMKHHPAPLLIPVLQLTLEARDNLKFLTTLERHFKNIMYGPLPGILDTLPPMMNALRMVWIISRHYSDDVTMGALFSTSGARDRGPGGGNYRPPGGHARWPCRFLLLHARHACIWGYFLLGLESCHRPARLPLGDSLCLWQALAAHASWLAWPTFTGPLGLCS